MKKKKTAAPTPPPCPGKLPNTPAMNYFASGNAGAENPNCQNCWDGTKPSNGYKSPPITKCNGTNPDGTKYACINQNDGSPATLFRDCNTGGLYKIPCTNGTPNITYVCISKALPTTPCSAMTATIFIESFELSMIDQSAPCADLSQICIGGIDYANTAGDIVLDLKNFADKKIIVSDPSKLPKLEMITIMNADTTLTPSLLESIPKLTQLTTLAIQDGNLQNLPSFTSSVNLSTLSLAGNNISNINTSFLSNFTNLYNLDLTNNPKTCALTNPKACLKCPPTLPNKIHCKNGVS